MLFPRFRFGVAGSSMPGAVSVCKSTFETLGAELTCPWHAARFDLVTGTALCPPARGGVRVYKVQVVGDEIQIDMP